MNLLSSGGSFPISHFPSSLFLSSVAALSLYSGFSSFVSASDPAVALTPLKSDQLAYLSDDNFLEKRSVSSGMSVPSAQLECAERLGVDLSDCNEHGVFIARTSRVSQFIMTYLRTNSLSTVRPEDLLKIYGMRLINIMDATLNVNDFDGFENLFALSLASNNLEYLPSTIFDPLISLIRLDLYDNPLKVTPSLYERLSAKTNLDLVFLDEGLNDTLSLVIDQHTIQFSNLDRLFYLGVFNDRFDFLRLHELKDSLPSTLSPFEKAFFCKYSYLYADAPLFSSTDGSCDFYLNLDTPVMTPLATSNSTDTHPSVNSTIYISIESAIAVSVTVLGLFLVLGISLFFRYRHKQLENFNVANLDQTPSLGYSNRFETDLEETTHL